MTVRGRGKGYIDSSKLFAFTGPPPSLAADHDSEFDPAASRIYADDVQFVDEFADDNIPLHDQTEPDTPPPSDDDGNPPNMSDSESDATSIASMTGIPTDEQLHTPVRKRGYKRDYPQADSPLLDPDIWTDLDLKPAASAAPPAVDSQGFFDVEEAPPLPRYPKRLR